MHAQILMNVKLGLVSVLKIPIAATQLVATAVEYLPTLNHGVQVCMELHFQHPC